MKTGRNHGGVIKNLLFSVYRDANVWPREGSRTLPWAKCQIFLEVLFICNNIHTNLNKKFHTQLSYHSFKPLFLFFQISARSSLKKFENKKMVQGRVHSPDF